MGRKEAKYRHNKLWKKSTQRLNSENGGQVHQHQQQQTQIQQQLNEGRGF